MYLFQPKYALKVNVWITELSLGTGVCTSWESVLEWVESQCLDQVFMFLVQPKYALKVNVCITELGLGTGVCTS